jgi:hypothetical protein
MICDLHCHTKLSDGSMGIDDIIVLAEKSGVTNLAVTDLDCLAGTVRARLIGERHGINVIQGVEISAYDSENDREVFVLGYMSDSPDRLEGLCHRNLVSRKRAAQFMMIKAAQRFPITTDLVLKCAQGSTNVYPVHIMAALVESGITTELFGQLYNELFTEGKEKSILMKPKFCETAEVIQAIHDAGGIAILSHPGNYEGTNIVEKALESGIDGFEAWCPEHSEETAQKYAALAAEKGLLSTGGSSFRGRHNKSCVTLGSITTPEDKFAEFTNYKAKIRRQKAKAE